MGRTSCHVFAPLHRQDCRHTGHWLHWRKNREQPVHKSPSLSIRKVMTTYIYISLSSLRHFLAVQWRKRFLEKVQVGSQNWIPVFSKITFLSHTNTTHTLHLTRLQQVLSTMQIVLKRARRSGVTGYEPMGTFSPVLQSCTSTYHPETYFPKMVLSWLATFLYIFLSGWVLQKSQRKRTLHYTLSDSAVLGWRVCHHSESTSLYFFLFTCVSSIGCCFKPCRMMYPSYSAFVLV